MESCGEWGKTPVRILLARDRARDIDLEVITKDLSWNLGKKMTLRNDSVSRADEAWEPREQGQEKNQESLKLRKLRQRREFPNHHNGAIALTLQRAQV